MAYRSRASNTCKFDDFVHVVLYAKLRYLLEFLLQFKQPSDLH